MKRRTFLSQALACTTALNIPFSVNALGTVRSAKPLKLLILGGTNFVGPAIVEEAIGRGHEVTLFNRGITRPELFPNLEKLHGLRTESNDDLTAISGKRRWDAVIDVWPQKSALVDATAKLLADRVDYYHFISSIAVYRDFSQPGIVETADVRRGEEGYGGEKVRAEDLLAEIFDGRYGVSRCHAIFGPRDPGSSLHYWLRRLVDYETIVAPGDGKDPIQCVDVRDVASWTIESVERKLTGRYNLASPTLQFRQFLEACRLAVGSAAKLSWVDGEFIYEFGVRAFDELPLWVPKNEDPGFFQISSRKAQKKGLTFRGHAETITAAWRWYQSAFFMDTQFPHNGWGISREKEEKLLRAWRERA